MQLGSYAIGVDERLRDRNSKFEDISWQLIPWQRKVCRRKEVLVTTIEYVLIQTRRFENSTRSVQTSKGLVDIVPCPAPLLYLVDKQLSKKTELLDKALEQLWLWWSSTLEKYSEALLVNVRRFVYIACLWAKASSCLWEEQILHLTSDDKEECLWGVHADTVKMPEFHRKKISITSSVGLGESGRQFRFEFFLEIWVKKMVCQTLYFELHYTCGQEEAAGHQRSSRPLRCVDFGHYETLSCPNWERVCVVFVQSRVFQERRVDKIRRIRSKRRWHSGVLLARPAIWTASESVLCYKPVQLEFLLEIVGGRSSQPSLLSRSDSDSLVKKRANKESTQPRATSSSVMQRVSSIMSSSGRWWLLHTSQSPQTCKWAILLFKSVNVHELNQADQPRLRTRQCFQNQVRSRHCFFVVCRGMLHELDQVKQKEALPICNWEPPSSTRSRNWRKRKSGDRGPKYGNSKDH